VVLSPLLAKYNINDDARPRDKLDWSVDVANIRNFPTNSSTTHVFISTASESRTCWWNNAEGDPYIHSDARVYIANKGKVGENKELASC
jgi:hypothetical protein